MIWLYRVRRAWRALTMPISRSESGVAICISRTDRRALMDVTEDMVFAFIGIAVNDGYRPTPDRPATGKEKYDA